MKRTRVLRLVLLGGGLVAMTACGEQAPRVNDQTRRFACEQAKQQNLPNAAEICAQVGTSSSSSRTYHSGGGSWFPWFFGRSYSGTRTSYSGSWFSGRSGSTDSRTGSSAGSSSSNRGGFGTTSRSAGS